MNQRYVVSAMLGITLLISLLLYVFAEIDIMVASLFYDGKQFVGNRYQLFAWIHDSTRYVTITIIVTMVGSMLALWIKKKSLWPGSYRNALYVLLVLAIGPGLLVNAVFKDHWGRARPKQVELFGGDKIFTAPMVMADQCERNCSFTSGDPSVGFALISLVFLFGRKWLPLPLILGSLYGITRVIQGAHFFSDVIFSAMIVFWVGYCIHRLMFKRPLR